MCIRDSLLSVGLIPENELSRGAGVDMSPVTSGPIVNESLETNIEGVFACGNVLHVHDPVSYTHLKFYLFRGGILWQSM